MSRHVILKSILLLFFCSFWLSAQNTFVPLDHSNEEGVLEVLAVNLLGEPIGGVVRVWTERLEDGKRGLKIEGAPEMALQYGRYILTVASSGAYGVDTPISIDKPYQLVMVGLFVSPLGLPREGTLVRGRITKSTPKQPCRWIRLASLFSDREHAETKASEHGLFAFENMKPGRYLLTTIGDQGLCDTQFITVLDRSVQDIEVP